MIVIGVDPGTSVTGYGVVSETDGTAQCLSWGAIRTARGAPLSHRLKQIADGLRAVFEESRPDCMAIEETFVAKNPQSALKLGMARGVIMLVAEEAGAPVFEYSPLLVKQTLVGYGRAEKGQVRTMVKTVLGLTEDPSPLDASDALAVAVTHLSHAALQRKISR